MINLAIINTDTINDYSVDVYLRADDILGVSNIDTEFHKTCLFFVDATAECLLGADAFVPTSEYTAIKAVSTVGADLSKIFLEDLLVETDSGIEPIRLQITNNAVADSSCTFNIDVKFNHYRKGKPSVYLNKYSIRDIGGRIIILKNEYI